MPRALTCPVQKARKTDKARSSFKDGTKIHRVTRISAVEAVIRMELGGWLSRRLPYEFLRVVTVLNSTNALEEAGPGPILKQSCVPSMTPGLHVHLPTCTIAICNV